MMKPHTGIFGLLLLLPTATTHAMDAKTACAQIQPAVTEIRTQLPQDIDYMTTLTGVQLFFVSGNCLLNYNYVVKSAFLLKEMAEVNQQTDEENLEFLQTEEGKQSVKSVFAEMASNAANTHFAVFSKVSGMKITYTHAFDNLSIQPVVSSLIDNSLQ